MNKAAAYFTILLIVMVSGFWTAGCQGPTGPAGTNAALADSMVPVIEWIGITPGMTVDDTLILAVNVFDNPDFVPGSGVEDSLIVPRTSFYIAGFEFDGESVAVDSSQAVYEFRLEYTWSARLWQEGPYTLMARTWDRARNSATTRVIIVDVDHP